jgi:hypothetical protein
MNSPPRNQWGSNAQKAQTFQPDWAGYVVTKVRHVRAAMFSGMDTFKSEGFIVPMATGFIELVGLRAGAFRTLMRIGFAETTRLLLPSFQLIGNTAVGTIVLPSHCFGSALHLSNSPMAHFRLGGDGRRNAIGTDVALLNDNSVDEAPAEIEVGYLNTGV